MSQKLPFQQKKKFRSANFKLNIDHNLSFKDNSEDDASFENNNKDAKITQTKFLTAQEILGEGQLAYWTDFHFYKSTEIHDDVEALQTKFRRVNKIKNCLVIEPVGLFLQLIDSSQDPRSLQEYQAGDLM